MRLLGGLSQIAVGFAEQKQPPRPARPVATEASVSARRSTANGGNRDRGTAKLVLSTRRYSWRTDRTNGRNRDEPPRPTRGGDGQEGEEGPAVRAGAIVVLPPPSPLQAPLATAPLDNAGRGAQSENCGTCFGLTEIVGAPSAARLRSLPKDAGQDHGGRGDCMATYDRIDVLLDSPDERPRHVAFRGRWLLVPSDETWSRDQAWSIAWCWGVAEEPRGSLVVYRYYVNHQRSAVLERYPTAAAALAENMPADIMSLASERSRSASVTSSSSGCISWPRAGPIAASS